MRFGELWASVSFEFWVVAERKRTTLDTLRRAPCVSVCGLDVGGTCLVSLLIISQKSTECHMLNVRTHKSISRMDNLGDLEEVVEHIKGLSTSFGTKASYATPVKAYVSFCTTNGLLAFPADTKTLSMWSARLAVVPSSTTGEILSPRTIKYYVRCVGRHAEKVGYENPVPSAPMVSLLKGVDRFLGGRKFVTRSKLAVDFEMVEKIGRTIDHGSTNDLCLLSALCFTCEGLRKSEVCNNGLADHAIRIEDVDFVIDSTCGDIEGVRLTLRTSKTNQFGHKKEVFTISNAVSVIWLRRYWEMRPKICSPGMQFFLLEGGGRCLTRNFFSEIGERLVRCGILDRKTHRGWSGRSGRSGAASELFASGAPDGKILECGRWKNMKAPLCHYVTERAKLTRKEANMKNARVGWAEKTF